MSWSGSIDIGVTTCDPDTMELPAWALRTGLWLMTNSGIVHDSDPVTDPSYGARCSSWEEGNTLGVMRTSNVRGKLLFLLLFVVHLLEGTGRSCKMTVIFISRQ